MSGFEENYFLSVKDDSYVYNELETRVRLSKRRPVGGGSKVANLRLNQRYRPFNESEEKTQRKRLKAFDNEEELEAVTEEENEDEHAEHEEEGEEEEQNGEEEEEEGHEEQQHEDEQLDEEDDDDETND